MGVVTFCKMTLILSVIMLNVVMLSVVMLNVVALYSLYSQKSDIQYDIE